MNDAMISANPAPLTQAALDYQRIEKAITYLQTHFLEQPDLAEIARAVHLSEFHFQRLFTRWAGISPKRFLQFLTVEHAKRQLAEFKPVLEVALDSGLSSPGRLHDLFVSVDAVSPGEFKTRGADIKVAHGVHPTPFGPCLLGLTHRGICWLSFLGKDTGSQAFEEMKAHWSGANFTERPDLTAPVIGRIFSGTEPEITSPLSLLVMGTNFQVKVWQALLNIPAGAVASYNSIGTLIGAGRASRAIGSAVAHNAIAYLIPCHRIIRSTGLLGGYRWGETRKRAILAWEAARSAA
jgi:AraC family transcriptional regulator of adaptative response/methylated-DNA-[protein]-cysteine methyltransferase